MEEPDSFHPVWQDAEEEVPAGLHGRIMGQIALNEKLRRRRRMFRGLSVAAAFVIVGSAVLFLSGLFTDYHSCESNEMAPSYGFSMTMNCFQSGGSGEAEGDLEDSLAESKMASDSSIWDSEAFGGKVPETGAVLTTAVRAAECFPSPVNGAENDGGYAARAALDGQNLMPHELAQILRGEESSKVTDGGTGDCLTETPYYGDLAVVIGAFPTEEWDDALLEDWGSWRVYEAVPGLAEALGAECESTLIAVISEN